MQSSEVDQRLRNGVERGLRVVSDGSGEEKKDETKGASSFWRQTAQVLTRSSQPPGNWEQLGTIRNQS